MDDNILLNVENLIIHYEADYGIIEAVNNISFEMKKGETLGLVGETGAGKTTAALGIMRLLPTPPGKIIGGKIIFDGEDLCKKTEIGMRLVRGKKISMIFQDPMTTLNPVMTIGEQISEVILVHEKLSKTESVKIACKMLESVGIPKERYGEYPHQFSGGMKQRVVIAIALACNPKLLIADEPTTALDVTIQAQVLEMMKKLKQDFDTSMLLITHDLGVVAEICDRVAIMYAGEIVEQGTLHDIFKNAQHPYTIGLFQSLPSLDKDVERLQPIDGMMPNPADLPSHCSFYDRCKNKNEKCLKGEPIIEEVSPGHWVKCFKCGGKD